MAETPPPTEAAEPFPSLAALRAAHNDLIKRVRESTNLGEYAETVADFIRRGTATGALIEDEDDRMTGQGLLDYWSALLYRSGHEPPDATMAEFDSAAEPMLDDALCPYIGLDPFDESRRNVFFGRRRLIDFLVARLAQQRLIVLVGPSGSGKSSVIRAGVIPALKAGALPGSEGWRYLPMIIPGSDPLLQMAKLLEKRWAPRYGGRRSVDPLANLDLLLQPTEDDTVQMGHLRQDTGYLARSLSETGQEPVLLLVDQFEELFALCPDERVREAFIGNLLSLIEAPDMRHTVILAMRGDFESFIARTPALQAWFENARVQLLPLTANELREAIEKPAELVGLRFEPGVVDALIQEMLGEPAALPLLQFTLLRLWEERDHSRVTWEAYRRVGGGREAIARRADQLYASFSPAEQTTARRILLRMVRPGRGLEFNNRRIRRTTLYQIGEPRDRVDRVLEQLLAARLVRLTESATLSDIQVEIAHEALIRNWPDLVEWLNEERAALEVRRNLEAKAAEWERLGRQGGLLDVVQLAEAERWLQSPDARAMGYDESVAALVAASRAAIEEAEREREAAAQRELAQTRQLLDEQQRRADAERARAEEAERAQMAQAAANRRITYALVALAAMCVVAIGLAAWALQSAGIARTQEDKALSEASARATEAVALRTAQAEAQQNADAARISAAEAERNAETARQNAETARQNEMLAQAARQTAEVARVTAEQQQRQARAGELAAQAQAAVAREPQLALLLAAEALNVTLQAGEPAVPIAQQTLSTTLTLVGGLGIGGHTGPVVAVALDPAGQRLVTGSADTTARVWDMASLDAAPRMLDNGAPVTLMAISPDGRLLAMAGAGPEAKLWGLESPGEARVLSASGTLTALAFSPDGRFLALASDDGATRVWELANLDAAPRLMRQGGSPVRAVAMSPDGRWLLTGSADGIARLYDLNEADPVTPIGTSDRRRPLTALAFSPDGRWMLIGSEGGEAHLWGLGPRGFNGGPFVLRGPPQPITTLTFSPDSTLGITGSAEGTTFLWNVEARQDPPPRSVLRGHRARITSLAVSPDGARLVTTSEDGTAGLWDLTADDPGTTQQLLRGHSGPVNAGAISADGTLLVTGGQDATARVWTLDQPTFTADALPTAPDELIALACRVAGRGLTQQEWGRYLGPETTYQPACNR